MKKSLTPVIAGRARRFPARSRQFEAPRQDVKKHTKLKKTVAMGNMSGKDSGSPFGKGVRAAYHTSSLIKTTKRRKKK